MNPLHFFIKSRGLSGVICFGALLLAIAVGWTLDPTSFFGGYWFALMLWMQLSVGSLIVLLIQYLSGGKWGRAGAPLLRMMAQGLFVLVPLFIPPLLALPHIFSWTAIQPGVSSAVLVHKQIWLNQPFFIGRTIFYLAIFGLIAFLWCGRKVNLAACSGPVLVCTILLISIAPADWMMSLQPTFYSSLFPFMYFSASMVMTFAVLTGISAWMQLRGDRPERPELLLDYGKLLFASVLFWGYITFAQYIIIWTGNLPDEAEWYVARSRHGWQYYTNFVLLCYFAIPFCILLSHPLKQNPRKLLTVCAGLCVMQVFEVFWIMRPELGRGIEVTPFDFLMPVLIGGCWLWFVLRPAPRLWALGTPEVAHA